MPMLWRQNCDFPSKIFGVIKGIPNVKYDEMLKITRFALIGF